jgi:hypothetical protein
MSTPTPVVPVTFAALLRKRGSVAHLAKALDATTKAKKEDDRFWTLTVDKAGNGHAVIRFLDAPPQDGADGLPYVRIFSHAVKGPGGWLIDLCTTTINKDCPVCEANKVLWNSGIEANKKIASERKRKLTYISNILVVADPSKPETEGKVFLFKYGTKIYEKLLAKWKPEAEFKETPVDPCDMFEGLNFKLKARLVKGYRNYDSSEFAGPSPVAATNDEIQAIWLKSKSLTEFVAEKNFKTYEQTAARLAKVLGSAVAVTTAEQAAGAYNDADAGVVSKASESEIAGIASGDEADPEDLKFFENLADSE